MRGAESPDTDMSRILPAIRDDLPHFVRPKYVISEFRAQRGPGKQGKSPPDEVNCRLDLTAIRLLVSAVLGGWLERLDRDGCRRYGWHS